jgi:hypothetical protein
MNTETREINQSPLVQGVDERIAYTLTTTPWGSSPSIPAVVIKDEAGVDVTDDHTTGAASAGGDIVTTPLIHSLENGINYRLEISFTIGSNVFEAFAELYGQT